MAIKLPKNKGFTKAFTKTKLGYILDKEIGKGDFLWTYDYKPKLEDNAWHPSGHCTPSLLELYTYASSRKLAPIWREDEYPETITPRAIEPALGKIFQVGHFWHQYLQEICVRAGLCEPENVERRGFRSWGGEAEAVAYSYDETQELIDPFHWATGSADICPLEIPGHGDYLIDFKTMGSHVFRNITPSDQNAEKWECQLNVYMDFFDMEKSMIVGINKDSPHDYKEFEFYRNQPLIDVIYAKWEIVAACIDEGIAPPEDEVIELPLKGVANG